MLHYYTIATTYQTFGAGWNSLPAVKHHIKHVHVQARDPFCPPVRASHDVSIHHAGGFGERPKPTVIVRMREGEYNRYQFMIGDLVWLRYDSLRSFAYVIQRNVLAYLAVAIPCPVDNF